MTAIAAHVLAIPLFPMSAQAVDFISDTVVARVIGNSDGDTSGELQGAIITSNGNFSTDNASRTPMDAGQSNPQAYIEVMSTGPSGSQATGGYINIYAKDSIKLDGTTLVTDDFSVNKVTPGSFPFPETYTPVFTVNSTTGNTDVSGTLNVDGSTTTAGITNTGDFVNTGAADLQGQYPARKVMF